MSQPANATQIGDAWAAQRQGRQADAVKAFEAIIMSAPDDIDAHYGLGLALRAHQQQAAALQAFERALNLAQTKLDKMRSEVGPDNVLSSSQDDRYMMLIRMIGQRIDEVKQLAG
jgi:tetratricopeptide (TPR) repeat protein